jgi:beta-lactamase class A
MGITRRAVVAALLGATLTAGCTATTASTSPTTTTVSPTPAAEDSAPLKALEQEFGARLGVHATNVRTGQTLSYRADERFAILSTFKTYAAAALLHEHPLSTGYFDKVITYTAADLVANSPVTSTRVATGMTVAELCEAAVTKSDNTAANLMLKELGGPPGLTAFARSIKDDVTRLDRWETELNSAVPGDVRDTTTPTAIANAYQSVVLGDTLGVPERTKLKTWLLANTTGDERIRHGLPPTWTTGDRTGTGEYGTANDVAITWTPDGTPIVIAVLTSKATPDATADNALLARTAAVVADALA